MRIHLAIVALIAALAAPAAAAAQDEIRLSEILPALEGSELGMVSLGAAPVPGGMRVVRRSEVLAALRRAGRTAEGLAIPRVSRVRRGSRTIDADQLAERAQSAVGRVLAPCTVDRLTVRGAATVAEGDLAIDAEGAAPRHTGSATVVIVLAAGGRTTRIPAQARVTCPAPVVRPGASVRLLARFGNVVASAPGVARQPGRVGDVIRVTSLQSRAPLRARVIDANRAEVLP